VKARQEMAGLLKTSFLLISISLKNITAGFYRFFVFLNNCEASQRLNQLKSEAANKFVTILNR
jgi:hypothetical protein